MSRDLLWRVEAYRLAVFAAELGWYDATKLMRDRRTREPSDQLYRALGSIGANISDGYSRGGGRDRAPFYEYALGSARQSRGWYYNGRHVLGGEVAQHRIQFLTQIIRLLLAMVPDQRSVALREAALLYQVDFEAGESQSSDPRQLANLLAVVPMS